MAAPRTWPALTVGAAHEIAVAAEHELTHALPHLAAATVHLDPANLHHHHMARPAG